MRCIQIGPRFEGNEILELLLTLLEAGIDAITIHDCTVLGCSIAGDVRHSINSDAGKRLSLIYTTTSARRMTYANDLRIELNRFY